MYFPGLLLFQYHRMWHYTGPVQVNIHVLSSIFIVSVSSLVALYRSTTPSTTSPTSPDWPSNSSPKSWRKTAFVYSLLNVYIKLLHILFIKEFTYSVLRISETWLGIKEIYFRRFVYYPYHQHVSSFYIVVISKYKG